MDRVGNRLHVALEQSAGVGIGDHHPGHIGPEPGFQGFKIDAAIRRGGDVLHPIAREGRRRRVRAMGAFRHQHDLAGIALRLQRRADAEQAAKLAMRARLGAHGDSLHAGQRQQPFGKLVHGLQRTAHGLLRLERVDVGKTGQPRDLLIEARVVLHRAGTERERPKIDGIVLPRQARVMTHGFGLRQTRQRHALLSKEARQRRKRLRFGVIEIDATFAFAAEFEDQRLFQHQALVAAGGSGIRGHRGTAHFRAPSGRVERVHAGTPSRTSESAVASASMSSSVVVSVAVTSRP